MMSATAEEQQVLQQQCLANNLIIKPDELQVKERKRYFSVISLVVNYWRNAMVRKKLVPSTLRKKLKIPSKSNFSFS